MSENDRPPGDSLTQVPAERPANLRSGARRPRYGRFALAALGSIPWVGGVLSATAAADVEADQARVNDLHRQWLEEHSEKLKELGSTLTEILATLEKLGPEASGKVDEEPYLELARQGFRIWDAAATQEKRQLVKQVLCHAAFTHLCSDDVVRLFLDWIERYHEVHFAVIREIFKCPEVTRLEIWLSIHEDDEIPRDDSAEADLFKLVVSDLSLGRVVRQARKRTSDGRFLRQRQRRNLGPTLQTPFDDKKPYELTELGRQFVHYAMADIVPSLSSDGGRAPL